MSSRPTAHHSVFPPLTPGLLPPIELDAGRVERWNRQITRTIVLAVTNVGAD